MKILCMPGGLCNAKTMEAQLAPIIGQFSSDDDVKTSFRLIQGNNQLTVPQEFAGFFGPPPNYSFVDKKVDAFIGDVRKFPKTGDPAESMRQWKETVAISSFKTLENAIDSIMDIIDQDEEIEGVLGYSEGAWVAASAIIEEQYRQRKSGREPRIKFGVFIGGFPPASRETGEVVTADDIGQAIDIHTVHVMGTGDPYIDGGHALYDLCDPDKAEMFGHAGGHVIPRDHSTLQELADVMKETISEISA